MSSRRTLLRPLIAYQAPNGLLVPIVAQHGHFRLTVKEYSPFQILNPRHWIISFQLRSLPKFNRYYFVELPLNTTWEGPTFDPVEEESELTFFQRAATSVYETPADQDFREEVMSAFLFYMSSSAQRHKESWRLTLLYDEVVQRKLKLTPDIAS